MISVSKRFLNNALGINRFIAWASLSNMATLHTERREGGMASYANTMRPKRQDDVSY